MRFRTLRSLEAFPLGTFEQVTLRLDFLHALTDLSVKVVNSARVIEKTVDKAMTSHLLKRHQVETGSSLDISSRINRRLN